MQVSSHFTFASFYKDHTNYISMHTSMQTNIEIFSFNSVSITKLCSLEKKHKLNIVLLKKYPFLSQLRTTKNGRNVLLKLKKSEIKV